MRQEKPCDPCVVSDVIGAHFGVQKQSRRSGSVAHSSSSDLMSVGGGYLGEKETGVVEAGDEAVAGTIRGARREGVGASRCPSHALSMVR